MGVPATGSSWADHRAWARLDSLAAVHRSPSLGGLLRRLVLEIDVEGEG